MARFHINPETGEAGKCGAEKGQCPFGSADSHYDSAADARAAYEAQMGSGLSSKRARYEAQLEQTFDELYMLRAHSEAWPGSSESLHREIAKQEAFMVDLAADMARLTTGGESEAWVRTQYGAAYRQASHERAAIQLAPRSRDEDRKTRTHAIHAAEEKEAFAREQYRARQVQYSRSIPATLELAERIYADYCDDMRRDYEAGNVSEQEWNEMESGRVAWDALPEDTKQVRIRDADSALSAYEAEDGNVMLSAMRDHFSWSERQAHAFGEPHVRWSDLDEKSKRIHTDRARLAAELLG